MDDAKRAGETFDSIAEHFDRTRNRTWDEVIEFIKAGEGRLLDMGCGNGRHSLAALEYGYDVTGLDASGKLLDICRKKTNSMDWIKGDVKTLPFEKQAFNRVVCIAVIHHLKKNRTDCVKEIRRVLKSDGRALISTWAREQDRWELEEDQRDVMVPWHLEDGTVVQRFYHLYTLEELVEEVKRGELKVIRAYNSGGNNYVECRR